MCRFGQEGGAFYISALRFAEAAPDSNSRIVARCRVPPALRQPDQVLASSKKA